MITDYYVYAYLREDNSPYYIGMGRKGRAFASHRRGQLDFRPSDKSRIMFLKTGLTRIEALNEEVATISQYKLKEHGGILINLTSGGQCPIPSTETRQKMSKAHSGRPKTKEAIQKMVERRRMDGTFIPSAAAREKMSQAALGKRTGDKNPAARKVLAFTKDGVFIDTFDTARQAAKALNMTEKGWKHIPSVCRGRRPHTQNFIFKYAEKSEKQV